MPSPSFPEAPSKIAPTSFENLDQKLSRLNENKRKWARLNPAQRVELLERVVSDLQNVASEWAEASARAKGFHQGDPREGEEWLAGPYQVARSLRLMIESLQYNGVKAPSKVYDHASGHTVAQVFPDTTYDRLMFQGIKGEVWIQPGRAPTQGFIYKNPEHQDSEPNGRVTLVLGAGNISCIGPQDVLDQLLLHNSVCLLKMNPVNDYTGPYVEKAFATLIEYGFMEVAYGGIEVGQYLSAHDQVEAIHITGSAATHDAIVWGSNAEEQERNKAASTPINTKPISSELGAVTPLIVVPGEWSQKDIEFQAEHVAGMISHNASFDCNAVKAIVTQASWPQRQAFLDALRKALRNTPQRKAYYPGAQSRYDAFLSNYPQAEALGERHDDVVPWTMIQIDEVRENEYALTHEAFCGLVTEVTLDSDRVDNFLSDAVRFCNEKVWGSLSCAMLVHPETIRAHHDDVERALARLEYGGIGLNIWPGTIYGLVSTTWGAYPKHTLDDVQSGIGVVHNSFFFDHPLKSIVRAPFRMSPKPIWFPNHKTLTSMAKTLTSFEAKPSLGKFIKIVVDALRG